MNESKHIKIAREIVISWAGQHGYSEIDFDLVLLMGEVASALKKAEDEALNSSLLSPLDEE
jgi:hypothetical protein